MGCPISRLADRFGLQTVLKRLEQEPEAARLVLNFFCLRSFQKAIMISKISGITPWLLRITAILPVPSVDIPTCSFIVRSSAPSAFEGYTHIQASRDLLDAMAKRSSFLERRAETAERELRSIKAARYLDRRIGDVFAGVIMGVSSAGVYVQLMEVGLDGLLPLREFTDDYYEIDRDRMALVGRRSGTILGVGTQLRSPSGQCGYRQCRSEFRFRQWCSPKG